MHCRLIALRKYELIHAEEQECGWRIETRKRLSGKLKNNTYKVYISKEGVKYYSLAKATRDGGFQGADGVSDGRKKRAKRKAKAKPSKS